MVGVTVQGHIGDEVSSEWVADFQIVLATDHLPGVSLCGSGIAAQRVVHPLANFMGHDGRVHAAEPKYSSRVEI